MYADELRWLADAYMPPQKRAPTHPGKILQWEFLDPLKITQHRLAVDIGVPPRRINEIIHGLRGVTADTALRLEKYFGLSALFWMSLQARYEVETARQYLGSRLDEVRRFV